MIGVRRYRRRRRRRRRKRRRSALTNLSVEHSASSAVKRENSKR